MISEYDLKFDVSETEISQAVLDLKYFGVCKSKALFGLAAREYIDWGDQYFKPIPWSMSFASLNENGLEHALSVEINNLNESHSHQFSKIDIFQPSDIGTQYTGHLVFHPARIEELIQEGLHKELARVNAGQISFYRGAAAKSRAHPDYFASEEDKD